MLRHAGLTAIVERAEQIATGQCCEINQDDLTITTIKYAAFSIG
jgi:hypothetical protein